MTHPQCHMLEKNPYSVTVSASVSTFKPDFCKNNQDNHFWLEEKNGVTVSCWIMDIFSDEGVVEQKPISWTVKKNRAWHVVMWEFRELWMDLLLGGNRVFCAFWLNMCWEGGTTTLIQKQNPGCCGRLRWWINIRPNKLSYLVSGICCRWTLWMKEWREQLQRAMERLRERVWGLIEVQILLLSSLE